MGIAVPSVAAILAACANDNGSGSGGGEGSPALQLARPDSPVTLPLTDQNPAIADGLTPESGQLKIYGYADYIWKKDRNRFSDKYGVDIEYTSFEMPEEMIAKMQAQGSSFDLLVTITLENVGKMATGALIQPLNHNFCRTSPPTRGTPSRARSTTRGRATPSRTPPSARGSRTATRS
jgi:spermidine/putrescine transport system substrate-binding protein